jgi:DNA-binding NarL/FixJ family response regulator
MTTVVLADDHPVFVDGLRALLSSMDIEVLGTASSGEEAVRVAQEHRPDVVVMDLHMPEMNGIEATAALTASKEPARVLVLSMLDDDDSVFAALRAGAAGYVLKDAGQDEIVRAIEAVARGEVIFGASIAKRVLEHLSGAATSPRPFPQLTEREHEILELVAEGASNQSIAKRLFLSEKTVRNNVSNVLAKLHVSGRSEAIVKAREAGLGKRSPEPDSL